MVPGSHVYLCGLHYGRGLAADRPHLPYYVSHLRHGGLLFPISRFIDSWLTGLPGLEDAGQDRLSRAGRAIRHGLVYMVLIFIAEYITGIWLTSMGICPWNYSLWPDNVGGVIRLKFAPLWFMTGLLFEYLTKPKGGE